MMRKMSLAAAALLLLVGGPARAGSTFQFDFNGLSPFPPPATTPFTLSSGGLDASFSTPTGAASAFQVGVSFFSFPGNVVETPGYLGQQSAGLDITFSSPISIFSGFFATYDSVALTLTALSGGVNGTVVGSESVTGTSIVGFPEGVISFAGLAFDTIVLAVTDDPNNPNFALGSFTVAAPEPTTLALLGTTLFGFGLIRRRRRA